MENRGKETIKARDREIEEKNKGWKMKDKGDEVLWNTNALFNTATALDIILMMIKKSLYMTKTGDVTATAQEEAIT